MKEIKNFLLLFATVALLSETESVDNCPPPPPPAPLPPPPPAPLPQPPPPPTSPLSPPPPHCPNHQHHHHQPRRFFRGCPKSPNSSPHPPLSTTDKVSDQPIFSFKKYQELAGHRPKDFDSFSGYQRPLFLPYQDIVRKCFDYYFAVWLENFLLQSIPDICHFFYTGKIFGE